ncbi:alpha/beta hydrolase [Ruania alkalisoli]|uniref:Alpha/beta hydrolase n=1 Tax=Ruania alkalisoli TaxID=2779775 RepID=A0A7M1SSI8_9MICO|nr:alpha/beta hydrolase [Ruania alkalisoli]QOR69954.1 alpha/beta hydrolase [Ruania alkalisoli]
MSSTTVLLVHGIRTSSSMWTRVQADLDAAGMPSIAVDLPGHGRRMDEEFTLAAADETLERAAAQAPASVVAVGLSLGGYLTLRWAARTDARVAGVLAASCAVRPRGLPLAAYVAIAGLIHRLPDRGRGLHDLTTYAILGGVAAREVSAGGVALDAMVPTLQAMGEVDPIADLARLEVPVWLVNGAWDHFRLEESRFARAAYCSRRIRIRGAGHVLTADRPHELARLVRTLVRSVA